ncbi:ABC transporter permease [Candidatus Woesearchaeota archaeon]|nr:ABC transporter permease [Candidatus Woesearchaeota archaeon]
MKLLAIIRKNITILLRNRLSTSLILLGPIALLVLIGVGFNTNSPLGIKVGVYADKNSEITNDFIAKLGKTNFTIERYESEQKCSESVIKGRSHLCIAFPNAKNGSSGEKRQKVKFYVDYSRYNLVWTLINRINQQLTLASNEVSIDLTDDLLNSVKSNYIKLQEQQESIKSIQSGIDSINTQLDSLDLGYRFNFNTTSMDRLLAESGNSRQKIQNFRDSTISDLDDSQAKLDGLQAQAIHTRAMLDEQNSKLKQTRKVMQKAYDTINCSRIDHQDLSPYIYNEDLFFQKMAEKNSECSILLTTINQLNEYIAANEQQIQAIDQLLEGIQVSKAKISSMKEKTDAAHKDTMESLYYADANINLMKSQLNNASNELSEKQISLGTKMGGIKSSVRKDSELFAGMEADIGKSADQLRKITDIEPSSIINPFTTTIQGVATERKAYEFMIPILFAILITFVGILSASTLVIKEKKSKALFRNLISPSNDITFIIGTYLTCLIVLVGQLLFLLLIASLVLNVSLGTNPLNILWLIILSCSAFIFIGMIIGYIFKTEEIVVLTAVCIIALTIFFSGIILPLESIKPPLNIITSISPFSSTSQAMNKLMILGQDMQAIGREIQDLSIKLAALAILVVATYKIGKKNVI